MKYHVPTRQFVVPADKLEYVSFLCLHCIAQIRQQAKLPLAGYIKNGPMGAPQFAEASILELARALDIDLGAVEGKGTLQFGQLDVSESNRQ